MDATELAGLVARLRIGIRRRDLDHGTPNEVYEKHPLYDEAADALKSLLARIYELEHIVIARNERINQLENSEYWVDRSLIISQSRDITALRARLEAALLDRDKAEHEQGKLLTRAESAERDARRYQLLRSHIDKGFAGVFTIYQWDATYNVLGNDLTFDSGEQLDAAIDAALMSAEGKMGGEGVK